MEDKLFIELKVEGLKPNILLSIANITSINHESDRWVVFTASQKHLLTKKSTTKLRNFLTGKIEYAQMGEL